MDKSMDDLLRAAGISEPLPTAAEEPALFSDLKLALDEVAEVEPHFESGETQILVGDYHVNLKTITWEILLTLAAIFVAALEPTGIGKLGLAAQLIDLLRNFKGLIKKMDAGQLVVCGTVLQAQKAKKDRADRPPPEGVDLDEIKRIFALRKELVPPALDDILADLVDKEVLVKEMLAHAGPFYRIRF